MVNNLDKKVDELELSIRAMNALKTNDINTVKDIVIRQESELLRLPNFGRKSLNDVRFALDSIGLKMVGVNGEAKTNGDAEKLPTLFQEYNKEVIAKIKKVAVASLNHLIEKKEWVHKDVGTLFDEHRKVLAVYEKAILDLWD